jgi:threonine/homoserine/homoserine lactone efflux protein
MHDLLGPLILFASVMSLTPGPNVVLVTASAANFGFGRTIPQIVGMGLAGLFRAEPRLYTVLRYAGGAYLLYLAWCIARADVAGAPQRGPGRSAFSKRCSSR